MLEPLPPELEERIAVLEKATRAGDFSRASVLWLVALGVLLPLVFLILGWRL